MDKKLKGQLNFISGRRSIRSYKDKEVSDDLIRVMLEAAMSAPSACAKDPWQFIAVKDREQLGKIADGLTHGKMIASAGVGFVICGDIDAAHDNQLSYMLQDCSAAIENLLLAAHILGLGSVWLGVHPRVDRIEYIRRLFLLPENIIPISCIAVGYPDEKKAPRTRFNKDHVHYDKW